MLRPTPVLSFAVFSAALSAQIPDGYVVFGSQQGTAGQNGIFYAHPRDPLVPVGTIRNLPPSLAYDPAGARGCATVLYRASDGALIAGERAPNGTSVDLHVLHLHGDDVVWAQSFSVGTGAAFGEIAQSALLPDGRVVVAASGLTASSPLAQRLTTQYQWEGLGIVDTIGGGVTAIPVQNLDQVPGVLNGVAVAPDGVTVYFCNWINNGSGGLWSVPVSGGTAAQLAALPGGPSSLSIDNEGNVVMPALQLAPPTNVFVYDPVTTSLTPVPTTAGPLNCLAIETVTGNWFVATRESGTPPRSLYWMTPAGAETLLHSPNLATINGITVNPNPEATARGTPGVVEYRWALAPNPGGLPLLGSAFSLTVRAPAGTNGLAAVVFGFDRAAPQTMLGAEVHVDLANAVASLFWFTDAHTFAMPLPNAPALRGVHVVAQTLHDEGGAQLASSDLVELTVL